MNLEVLGAGKDFPAARERAWEGLLARVHSNVIDQFVLRLEGLALAGALLPVTDVVVLLWAPHMLHGDMCHQLMHGAEGPVAALLGPAQLSLVDPLARQLLLDGLPHVTEEGARPVVGRHVHAHVHVHGAVVRELRGGRVGVRARTGDRAVGVCAAEQLPAQPQVDLVVVHVPCGRRVPGTLLMQPGEEQVAGGFGNASWSVQAARRAGEEPVLPATRGRLAEPRAALAEEKVARGVEGGGGGSTVAGHLAGVVMMVMVVMAQGVCVTRTLRRERRALARRQIVSSGGAQLEGGGCGGCSGCGGVGRVPEGIQPHARRLAVGHLMMARCAEAAHSQPGELRASVQEHRHGWGVLGTGDTAEMREGAGEDLRSAVVGKGWRRLDTAARPPRR